jgi:hypothetical protein
MLHEAKSRPQGWKQQGLVHGDGAGPGGKPRLVVHRERRVAVGMGKQQHQHQRGRVAGRGRLSNAEGGMGADAGKSREIVLKEREAWEKFDQQVGPQY